MIPLIPRALAWYFLCSGRGSPKSRFFTLTRIFRKIRSLARKVLIFRNEPLTITCTTMANVKVYLTTLSTGQIIQIFNTLLCWMKYRFFPEYTNLLDRVSILSPGTAQAHWIDIFIRTPEYPHQLPGYRGSCLDTLLNPHHRALLIGLFFGNAPFLCFCSILPIWRNRFS